MTNKPTRVTRHNSTVNGYGARRWTDEQWSRLVFDDRVWVDTSFGLSYLHVPYEPPGMERDGIVYRVRPVRSERRAIKVDGVWCWVTP